jgi:GcrA cell cycle regulator
MGLAGTGLPHHHQRDLMIEPGINAPSWWTDARTDELKQRWRNGESGSEIARAMHATSRSAVIGKVHRLKLDSRRIISKAASGANDAAKKRLNRRRNGKTVHYVDGKIFVLQGEIGMVDETPPEQTDFKNPVRLIELETHHCRWPGDGCGPDLLCCGEPKLKGYPYCAAHCRIAYVFTPRPPRAPRQ